MKKVIVLFISIALLISTVQAQKSLDVGTYKGVSTVVFENGELWSWVSSDQGTKISKPKKIASHVQEFHNGAYLDDGQNLYVSNKEKPSSFTKIATNVTTFYAAAADKLVYIKENKELWGYGVEYAGEFGSGKYTLNTPEVINGVTSNFGYKYTPLITGIQNKKIATNVVHATVSGYSMAYVTTDNKAYILGENPICRKADATEVFTTPHLYMENAKELHLTSDYLLTLKTDNSLWFNGTNRYNASTLDADTSAFIAPTKIVEQVKRVYTSSNQIGVIKSDDALYMWGNNINKDLGYDIFGSSAVPTKVLSNVNNACLSGATTLAVTNLGEAYIWGSAKNGSLPFTDRSLFKLPAKIDFDNEQIVAHVDDALRPNEVVDGNAIVPPTWMAKENYYVFANDPLYISDRWAEIVNFRNKALDKTLTIEELEAWYRDPYTIVSDALNYELALLGEKLFIDSNYTNKESIRFMEDRFRPIDVQDKKVVLLKTQASLMAYNVVNRQVALSRDRELMPILKRGDISKTELYAHPFFDVYKTIPYGMSTVLKSIPVEVDGLYQDIDGVCQIVNGSTMVPMRGIVEAISGTVSWEEDTATAVMSYGGKTIRIKIGDQVAYVNGVAEPLPTTAYTNGGRTYIPLRFVSEHMNQKVTWHKQGVVSIEADTAFLDDNPIFKFMESMSIPHCSHTKSHLIMPRYIRDAPTVRTNLQNNWSISDRYDLVALIVRMTEQGHQNGMFLNEVAHLKSLSNQELANIRNNYSDGYMVDQMLNWGKKWGDTGVISYDLTRIVLLAQWGYNAGYLTLEESIAISLPAVEQYQSIFDNWDDAIHNYLDGYGWFSRVDITVQDTEYQNRLDRYEKAKEVGGFFDAGLFDVKLQPLESVTYESIRKEVLGN